MQPIAVSGLACRFPGAPDAVAFWRNLRAGVRAIHEASVEELERAGVDPAELADPAYVRATTPIAGHDRFAAEVFGLGRREAEILDPQQRLFLECAWTALEDAGVDPARFAGRIGVFAGAGLSSYLLRNLLPDAGLRDAVGVHALLIANDRDYLASRVSHRLDLRGPSLAVATACSTSLAAVHLACQSLAAWECDLALAGGVRLQVPHGAGYRYLAGGILSPDGHCRAFAADAAGTVPGDGVGIVVLTRHDDPVTAGLPVRALVRGWAMNNDGAAKVGFAAPSADGQAAVVAEALEVAEVTPASVGYVEAHGTGTPLGDPIEVAALRRVFDGETADGEAADCGVTLLGSVKSAIGHLDAAAGVAGLIKTVLALEHGEVPPTLDCAVPSPRLGLDGSRLRIARELQPWPRGGEGGEPRRAGVSAFGIGGTNVHLVLEEAPAAAATASSSRTRHLLVLSAATPAAVTAQAERLARHLREATDRTPELADVAATLALGRRQLEVRLAVVAGDATEAADRLEPAARTPPAAPRPGAAPAVVFLFPGQGAQRPGMARGLYAAEPVFRAAIDRATERLRGRHDLDLRDLLLADPDDDAAAATLRHTRFAQPALFVVGHALASLWQAWGVRPAALVGHSLGELTAAAVAGVLDLDDALDLVATRAAAMEACPAGAMLGVALGAADLAARLEPPLELAAVNAPRRAVATGPEAAIAELAARLTADGVPCRRLDGAHGFHSAAMAPAMAAVEAALGDVVLRPPSIPLASGPLGAALGDGDATDPGYWARQLRLPVRFADGVAALVPPGALLLELGPRGLGGGLGALARQTVPTATPLATLDDSGRGEGEGDGDGGATMAALGALWSAGVAVDWEAVHGAGRRRLSLPGYPFAGARYWHPAPGGTATVARTIAAPTVVAPAPGGAAPRTPDELERVVAEVFAEALGIAAVEPDDDFFALGGDSLAAVQVGERLRQRLGDALPPGALLQASTVASVAALARGARQEGTPGATRPALPPSTVALSSPSSATALPPLFLVHPVGGHVYLYRPLARALGDRPIYGFRAAGLEDERPPLAEVGAMADSYLGDLRALQPRGPYHLGGSSFGGTVAFEMARRLVAEGEEMALLALFDTAGPGQMPAELPDEAAVLVYLADSAADDAATRHPFTAEGLRALPAGERRRRFLAFLRRRDPAMRAVSAADFARFLAVFEHNSRALWSYEHRPYPGHIVFFKARERRARYDAPHPDLPWQELAAGGLTVHRVPGNHVSMLEAGHVDELATLLAGYLAAPPGPAVAGSLRRSA